MEFSIQIYAKELHDYTWESDVTSSPTRQSNHRHVLMPYAFGHFNDSIASERKGPSFICKWNQMKGRPESKRVDQRDEIYERQEIIL